MGHNTMRDDNIQTKGWDYLICYYYWSASCILQTPPIMNHVDDSLLLCHSAYPPPTMNPTLLYLSLSPPCLTDCLADHCTVLPAYNTSYYHSFSYHDIPCLLLMSVCLFLSVYVCIKATPPTTTPSHTMTYHVSYSCLSLSFCLSTSVLRQHLLLYHDIPCLSLSLSVYLCLY